MSPFDASKPAVTSQDWTEIANRHRNTAAYLLAMKHSGSDFMIYDHIGRAIESAMLAVVARQKRYNTWPTRAQEPDLHGHRLRKIAKFADIRPPPNRRDLMPKFHALLDWDPNRRYNVGNIEFDHVQDLYDAAFGNLGVYAWLRSL